MSSERLVRLKVLPRRLRVAHLAALERALSYPSTLASASLRPSLPTASREEGSETDGRSG